MHRTAVMVAFLLLVSLLVGCGGKDKGNAKDGGGVHTEDSKTGSGAVQSNLTVSATELYAAYKADPKTADQRFKGKRLAVTGEVDLRDDHPRGFPNMVRFGLKGSSKKNELVTFLFDWEYERYFIRLDAKPSPPIIGTCEGAFTSEYGKKGARPMEVRMTRCEIPNVPGAKTHYDVGYAKGEDLGKRLMAGYMRSQSASVKEVYAKPIREMLDTLTKTHRNAASARGGIPPSKLDEFKGELDGYRKAIEASGIK